MTAPEIERLASEAGIWLFEDLPQVEASIGTLRIFAALIAAHERERCAKVCEAIGENGRHWPDADEGSKANVRAVRNMIGDSGEVFAAAIRAL